MGTPVHDNPATGPKTRSADRPKPKAANIISFQPIGVRGLNTYSENIPNGEDAIGAFEAATQTGEFAGQKVERCAICVGGTRVSNKSLTGSTEIVSWTPAGGIKGDDGWQAKVAGAAPAAVAAPPATRVGGDSAE